MLVQTALLLLDGLSEPSRLVLLGISLIAGALVLRRLLLPVHAELGSTSKVGARSK